MNEKTDVFEKTAYALQEAAIIPPDNPLILFENWFLQAQKTEPNDPNAMGLASVDADNRPSLRQVLLKSYTIEQGFVFYTNFDSRKGQELQKNPYAALLFHWKSQRQQIRISGPLQRLDEEQADLYFATRPRASQIGAWASQQSREMESYQELQKRVEHYTQKFADQPIPRPQYWGGMAVIPLEIEFWQDRPFRLHERVVYQRGNIQQVEWKISRLYP